MTDTENEFLAQWHVKVPPHEVPGLSSYWRHLVEAKTKGVAK